MTSREDDSIDIISLQDDSVPDKVCPVVRAIHEIRGGGIYSDDAESDPTFLIKLGGGNGQEILCDHVSFYIMTRKMELARFELGRPDTAACAQKCVRMFGHIAGQTYSHICTELINKMPSKKYIYDQFTQLLNMVTEIEYTFCAHVSKISAGDVLNVSLPDINMPVDADELIVYRPDVLREMINKLVNYINGLNINSIISEPVSSNIKLMPIFDGQKPDMTQRAVALVESKHDSAEEYLTLMNQFLTEEMTVAQYVLALEKYQCTALNCMNEMYSICKKIIEGLIARLH